jgi:hypothetical protein
VAIAVPDPTLPALAREEREGAQWWQHELLDMHGREWVINAEQCMSKTERDMLDEELCNSDGVTTTDLFALDFPHAYTAVGSAGTVEDVKSDGKDDVEIITYPPPRPPAQKTERMR